MCELGYIPRLLSPSRRPRTPSSANPVVQPFSGFRVVQPFPVIEITGPQELVVAPREYGTLVEHPVPIAA